MTQKEFEDITMEALKRLPKEFGDELDNIDIVIEDEPNMDSAKRLGLGTRGRLLGLYQGVPLKDRTHYYGMVLPDKITLYKKNIEQVCAARGLDIKEEIEHVVQHEIAHHFGISDERLTDLDIY